MTHKIISKMSYNVPNGMLNPAVLHYKMKN